LEWQNVTIPACRVTPHRDGEDSIPTPKTGLTEFTTIDGIKSTDEAQLPIRMRLVYLKEIQI
jgi:hypothetical protein